MSVPTNPRHSASSARFGGTLQLRCPVCASDTGEPIAVGSDFANAVVQDSYLAVQCTECSTVYLSPPPAPTPRRSGLDLDAAAKTVAAAITDLLTPGAHVRCIGPERSRLLNLIAQRRPDVGIAHGSGVADIDVVILVSSLERSEDPLLDVTEVFGLLRPSGRIVTIGANAGSSSFQRFGERHWAGYDFPLQRQVFSAGSVKRLFRDGGFRDIETQTLAMSEIWERSVANVASDIDPPRWLRRMVGSTSISRSVEAIAQRRGRGSLLLATGRKP